MNKRETKFWQKLQRKFSSDLPKFEVERVENKAVSFMPDVRYSTPFCQGWVELKCGQLSKDRTTIDLKHFTRGQKNWIITNGKRHDYCWMLCQCYTETGQDTTYFLLDHVGVEAIKPLTTVPWSMILKHARRIWTGGMDIGSLALALQESQEDRMMATDPC